jgi:regulator of sigma E protease
MNTFFAFILVLGPLIFVHEFGHFVFAKLFGVRVLKFSLGFGPKVVSKVWGETEYVISALPLGGYVKMFGENPDEQDVPDSEKRVAFAHKTILQRFFIVLAGPCFNLIFPIVLFFLLFLAVGVPQQVDTTRIGEIIEDSPAQSAGIKVGDEIVEINGQQTEKWIDVLNAVKGSGGEKVTVLLARDGKSMELQLKPVLKDIKNVFGEVVDEQYLLGIAKANEITYNRVGIVESLQDALDQTWLFISLTGQGFAKIIQGKIPASELGGPILIAQLAGRQIQEGWMNFAYLIGIISVNLGLLNLLPIPVLDGGHLAFLTVEAIRRKPMDEKAQMIAQQIGLAFIGALMIFVFYNDIARLLPK